VQDLKGLGYEKGKPVGLVGVTELSEAQKKQLKEQQEMQQMYDMIMKHKQAIQEMQIMWEKAIQQHEHGYDSDEEVDSELGTWEHQLRRMEMDKTRGAWEPPSRVLCGRADCSEHDWNSSLGQSVESSQRRGKTVPACFGVPSPHGLGITGGRSDPSRERFASRLRRRRPLSPALKQRGTTTVDGAGFGIDRPAELTKEDDEYEAFRKRMMLAYRFRPNPLNNPRRPYY
ncbi:SURP and G-patch domain-containing protein 1, partial [Eurypyga helias]